MPAPKGNKHAFKHGIYSNFIAAIDDEQMLDMVFDSNKDEIAYARVRLASAQRALDSTSTPDDQFKWDQACRHWTEIIITAISNTANRRETEIVIYETILDAVRRANDRQGVK